MAELIRKMRVQINDFAFYEIKIWRIPKTRFFEEGIKYSMVIIETGKRILSYDNESKHVGEKEVEYNYRGIEALLKDFEKDVKKYRGVKNEDKKYFS